MGVFVVDRKGDQDGMIMTIIIVIVCCMNVEECCMLISCVVERHYDTFSDYFTIPIAGCENES